eukprot:TRINITY_DN8694_c0_g1_i2.p1 TRINITY_DN8694_c0_g1~~TRINITY_DN8694_c0_g1_i2.p1  ORF type:complete len:197 (+),score=34.31 TRINITY_DN8694_c0_g1_i2:182-772(+)
MCIRDRYQRRVHGQGFLNNYLSDYQNQYYANTKRFFTEGNEINTVRYKRQIFIVIKIVAQNHAGNIVIFFKLNASPAPFGFWILIFNKTNDDITESIKSKDALKTLHKNKNLLEFSLSKNPLIARNIISHAIPYPFLTNSIKLIKLKPIKIMMDKVTVSYTHLRAHETRHDLVCRLLLEKKKKHNKKQHENIKHQL